MNDIKKCSGADGGRPLPREALSPGLCGARLDTLAEKPGRRPEAQVPTARAGLSQTNAIVVALPSSRAEYQALARIDLMTPADTGILWRIML